MIEVKLSQLDSGNCNECGKFPKADNECILYDLNVGHSTIKICDNCFDKIVTELLIYKCRKESNYESKK